MELSRRRLAASAAAALLAGLGAIGASGLLLDDGPAAGAAPSVAAGGAAPARALAGAPTQTASAEPATASAEPAAAPAEGGGRAEPTTGPGGPTPLAPGDAAAEAPAAEEAAAGGAVAAPADEAPSAEAPTPGEPGWLPAIEVVDADGAPVPGVRVRLYPPCLVGARLLAELRTDAAGRAPLPAVAGAVGPTVDAVLETGERLALVTFATTVGGRVVLDDDPEGVLALVRVEDPAGSPLQGAQATAFIDALAVSEATTDAEGFARLRLPRADRTRVEVLAGGHAPARWRASGGHHAVRLRRGEAGGVAGRAVDADGRPVAGALVRALVPEGTVGGAAATDADGRFRLDGLPPGRVTLEVWREADVPDEAASALVAAGRTCDVTLVVRGRGALEVVVTDGGRPVAGASVDVVDPAVTRFGDFEASGAERRGRTDAAGRLVLAVPPGAWHLRVASGVLGREALAGAVVPGAGAATVAVDLARARTLVVRAVDPDGRPVPSVFMDVSMPGIAWRDMPSATTDGQGLATFEHLPPGPAEVHVGDDFGQWRMVVADGDRAEVVITPPADLLARIRLPGLTADAAERLDAVLVTVLPGAVAVLHAPALAGVTATRAVERDPDGAPVLVVRARTPGGGQAAFLVPADPALAPVALGPAGGRDALTVEAEARLGPGASVRGRLTLAGHGVAGRVRLAGEVAGALAARAQWLGATANDPWLTVNEWSVAAGPDGAFELGGLPPGAHRLLVEPVGGRPRTVELELAAGQARDLGAVAVEP